MLFITSLNILQTMTAVFNVFFVFYEHNIITKLLPIEGKIICDEK